MSEYSKMEHKKIPKYNSKKAAQEHSARQNLRGIPDVTKSRFENRSEYTFNDVRIHYQSDKPVRQQSIPVNEDNELKMESNRFGCTATKSIQLKSRNNISSVIQCRKRQDFNADEIALYNEIFKSPSRLVAAIIDTKLDEAYFNSDLNILRVKLLTIQGELRDSHINSLHDIAGNADEYPYGGFLSKGLQMPKMKNKGVKGMNCWGAILLAAKNAEFIDEKNMKSLDGGVVIPRLLSAGTRIVYDPAETIIEKGYIVSTIQILDLYTEMVGDHVFLSLGVGKGKDAGMEEVDGNSRGTTNLGVILEHHGSMACREMLDGKESLDAGKIILYTYRPPWE